MAEPTATSAGISLTVLSVALLGPTLGPYALIAFASLAGAQWPLLAADTDTRMAGAWLLLRCMLTAVFITAFLAGIIERIWGLPLLESLAPVAFIIGALGNGWQPVFGSLGSALQALIGRQSGEKP